jgi:hypothetical protein
MHIGNITQAYSFREENTNNKSDAQLFAAVYLVNSAKLFIITRFIDKLNESLTMQS